MLKNGVREPGQTKYSTGVKYGFELNEMISFPLRYKDLGPLARLSITIYDMDKEYDDEEELTPLACTVVDLFDKNQTLRQGTWNLHLYKNREPD